MQAPSLPKFERAVWLALVAAVVVTFLVMAPNLQHGWTGWDDDEYVLENAHVTDFSVEKLGELFTTYEVQGNYHPLTMLSLALDYAVAGDEASTFHRTNILLHALNVALVFWLIFLLAGRWEIALFVALLFGVHPMHLESVAWISARKDVLYTAFFIGGMIAWWRYVHTESSGRGMYALTFFLFLCSLLSKPMAVTFPLVLLLLDYLRKRSDWKKLLLEKVPFFALALGLGLLTTLTQRASGATADVPEFNLLESIAIAGYGTVMYLAKAIFPFQLSAFHPYPMAAGEALPGYFYAFPVILLALAYLAWRYLRKDRPVLFGLTMFLVVLAPVSQLLPFGSAVIAERYTYVAYIGLFWAMALFLTGRWSLTPPLKLGGAALIGLMAVLTVLRAPVWQSDETLWTDVIDKYPSDYYAYGCRALHRDHQGQPQAAMADYNRCLQLNPRFAEGFLNRGFLRARGGDYQNALKDYDVAIQLDPNAALAWLNRGSVLLQMDQNDLAIKDLSRALTLNPDLLLAWQNRGVAYKRLGQYQNAIRDYDEALRHSPNDAAILYNRGVTHYLAGAFQAGVHDLDAVIAQLPNDGRAWYYRSRCYRGLGDPGNSIRDANQAVRLQYPIPDEHAAWLHEVSVKGE